MIRFYNHNDAKVMAQTIWDTLLERIDCGDPWAVERGVDLLTRWCEFFDMCDACIAEDEGEPGEDSECECQCEIKNVIDVDGHQIEVSDETFEAFADLLESINKLGRE